MKGGILFWTTSGMEYHLNLYQITFKPHKPPKISTPNILVNNPPLTPPTTRWLRNISSLHLNLSATCFKQTQINKFKKGTHWIRWPGLFASLFQSLLPRYCLCLKPILSFHICNNPSQIIRSKFWWWGGWATGYPQG